MLSSGKQTAARYDKPMFKRFERVLGKTAYELQASGIQSILSGANGQESRSHGHAGETKPSEKILTNLLQVDVVERSDQRDC